MNESSSVAIKAAQKITDHLLMVEREELPRTRDIAAIIDAELASVTDDFLSQAERICEELAEGYEQQSRKLEADGAIACGHRIHDLVKKANQPPQITTETAWLLERNQTPEGPEYLTISGGCFEWTTDSLKALRLSRREDADALAEIIDDCQHVREHQWG